MIIPQRSINILGKDGRYKGRYLNLIIAELMQYVKDMKGRLLGLTAF